jgi:20S proteasome subunit beta 7
MNPTTHTTTPILTGGSVIAVKYADGVLMCCDTLASFGSMSRYKDVRRMAQLGDATLIGSSGEYSDFQNIVKTLREVHLDDWIS